MCVTRGSKRIPAGSGPSRGPTEGLGSPVIGRPQRWNRDGIRVDAASQQFSPSFVAYSAIRQGMIGQRLYVNLSDLPARVMCVCVCGNTSPLTWINTAINQLQTAFQNVSKLIPSRRFVCYCSTKTIAEFSLSLSLSIVALSFAKTPAVLDLAGFVFGENSHVFITREHLCCISLSLLVTDSISQLGLFAYEKRCDALRRRRRSCVFFVCLLPNWSDCSCCRPTSRRSAAQEIVTWLSLGFSLPYYADLLDSLLSTLPDSFI